jgi:S-DNA-T family DNA segregation ATPase FtsK/SpoIIIE
MDNKKDKNTKPKIKKEDNKVENKNKLNSKNLIHSDIKKNITAILLIIFSLLFLLSLINQAGLAGNYINQGLALAFGWSRFLLPVLLLVLGFVYFRRYDKYRYYLTTTGAVLFIFFLASLMHNFYSLEVMKEVAQNGKGGGYIGFGISFILVKYTGILAAYVVSLGFFLIGLILTFNFPLNNLFKKINDKYFILISKLKTLKFNKDKEEEISLKKEEKTNIKENSIKFSDDKVDFDDNDKKSKSEDEDHTQIIQPKVKKENKTKNKGWRLPPLSLLKDSKKRDEPKNLDQKADLIIKTLADFGIDVYFKGYNVGPSMVQYAFEPAKGVRLSKIVTLQNNLAMALATSSIRIEAPIPGKSLVGIELPLEAEYKEEVRIKAILESADFQESKSDLTIALGKDVYGNFILADIQKMPHLMVAGATNTGKSVCINTILASLLYQNSPEKLKLLLIDPKRVELNFYNEIPHLASPVIVEPAKVVKSLQWAVNEMESRYKILEELKVRDIKSFNEKAESGRKRKVDDEKTGKTIYEDLEIMPYVVIVIDELNDLMMAYGKEVEALIVRLVQKSRAVGIHMIVSTQKPTVEVITGLMKSNITTRIALRVATQVDSRTILDAGGAESLLGNGDMLLKGDGAYKMKRIQGAFISDEETLKVVDYIKEVAESQNIEVDSTSESLNDYLKKAKGTQVSLTSGFNNDGDEVDDFFEEAKQIAISCNGLSASSLMTRLSVGWQRASRIIYQLEQAGIIGPQNGAKPRELLIGRESAENLEGEED